MWQRWWLMLCARAYYPPCETLPFSHPVKPFLSRAYYPPCETRACGGSVCECGGGIICTGGTGGGGIITGGTGGGGICTRGTGGCGVCGGSGAAANGQASGAHCALRCRSRSETRRSRRRLRRDAASVPPPPSTPWAEAALSLSLLSLSPLSHFLSPPSFPPPSPPLRPLSLFSHTHAPAPPCARRPRGPEQGRHDAARARHALQQRPGGRREAFPWCECLHGMRPPASCHASAGNAMPPPRAPTPPRPVRRTGFVPAPQARQQGRQRARNARNAEAPETPRPCVAVQGLVGGGRRWAGERAQGCDSVCVC